MKQGRNCRQLPVNALENVIEKIHDATSSPAAGKQSLILQKQPNLWHFISKRCTKPADQTGVAQGFLLMANICFRTNKWLVLEALTWNQAELANQNLTIRSLLWPNATGLSSHLLAFAQILPSLPDGHTVYGQTFHMGCMLLPSYGRKLPGTAGIQFLTKLKADSSACKLSTCAHKVSRELYFFSLHIKAMTILSAWSAAVAEERILERYSWVRDWEIKWKREFWMKGVKTLSVSVPSVWCCSGVTSHPPVVSTHALPLSTPPNILLWAL